ncbi:MAG: hypothetical protein JXB39_01625 [Deltaproteobacteria bacterium]|nr:hypothetical protein [Deltaproteobacteria bacterium]
MAGTPASDVAQARLLARVLLLVGEGLHAPEDLAARLRRAPERVAGVIRQAEALSLVTIRGPHPRLTLEGLAYLYATRHRGRTLGLLARGGSVLVGNQVRLGLPRPRPPATGYHLVVDPEESRRADDPALYRVVLQALLDEAEIPLPLVADALAEAGAGEAPTGAYVDAALRRGDAWRLSHASGERLLVTPSAVARRHLSDTVAAVALSDPAYREYLDALVRASRGDPAAAVQYGRWKARFSLWDDRLFGPGQRPRDLAPTVEQLLTGGTLEAIPLARPGVEPVPVPVAAPFLHLLDRRSLFLALPPSTDLLAGGVHAVNRLLEAHSVRPGAPLPSVLGERAVVHGGLLHPGEPPIRRVADGVSLRLRALERIPHLAVLAALLLLHRRTHGALVLRLRGDRVRVNWRRQDLGPLLDLADGCMRRRGWTVSRRFRGGLSIESFVDVAEALGVVTRVGPRLVLQEDFAWRLREDPEDRQVHVRLQNLADLLLTDLDTWVDGAGS